ncbi:MAG: DUF3696 domain-containing protein [Thermoguttaceae bacterium]
MITELQIKNFKIWEDTGLIRMAPITLFFGTNSSGKSSIGQFLMMLKQTAEQSDRQTVLNPGGNNTPVQLGSFGEMVSHRDTKNKIEFSYSWQLPQKLEIKDPITQKTYCGQAIRFNAIIGSDTKKAIPVVQEFGYLVKNGSSSLTVGMKKQVKDADYVVNSSEYVFKRNLGRVWPIKSPMQFYGFPDEVPAYHQNAEFVKSLNLEHENMFKSISYLGPLRTKTERLYTWSGTQPESVDVDGRNTVPAILAGKDRKIALYKKRNAKPFEEVIATQLKRMGLIEEIKVNRISEGRHEYEVKVRTKGSRDFVDLPDVGFGISQVLPVLVQCFYAPAGSVIIMEQPEIHLHPSAQSALADVMIDVIKSRENGKDRGIQLIIETHSEHFLRRFQRRIAEESLSNDEFVAYFADTTKPKPTLEQLKINEYGGVENWPKDFFGDEMGDIFAQNKIASQRRIKDAKKGGGA